MDAEWAETGDRYLIKLFRDYVFHQVDETGAPLIEMSHVIQCLNKVIFSFTLLLLQAGRRSK
jgi:PAB-dependent poly(A)-specific ribonuclease subunit 3